jgi:hypothetical protein
MEEILASETLITTHKTAWYRNPEERNLNLHRKYQSELEAGVLTTAAQRNHLVWSL